MLAAQVCLTCKGRKKKCDKRTPRCGYCEQKHIDCCYDYGIEVKTPSLTSSARIVDDTNLWATNAAGLAGHVESKDDATHPPPLPHTSIPNPIDIETTLTLEMTRIIRASRSSIEEIGQQYFSSLHLWVPFFSPASYHTDLAHFKVVPTAEFALLILSLCLITCGDAKPYTSPTGRDALYFHAKTMFTQVQLLRPPSIQLVRAGIFLSIYEYAHGHPKPAATTIDICARMAYMLKLHERSNTHDPMNTWNTWWAIRIFERIYYCETYLHGLPMISSALSEADLLPLEVDESDIGNWPESGLSITPVGLAGLGCLARAAQASYLLDRLFRVISDKQSTDKISDLIVLDSEIQRLLFATMNSCHGRRGGHCGAVGMSIRALFIIHNHILSIPHSNTSLQCRKHSEAALDTVAQIVVDIARSHREVHVSYLPIISPICGYVFRIALQHLYETRYEDRDVWFRDSDMLRASLAKLSERWPFESDLFSCQQLL